LPRPSRGRIAAQDGLRAPIGLSRASSGPSRLTHRKRHSILLAGLSAVVLRLPPLPLFPIFAPFVMDDFSILPAEDAFLHGRLTNPLQAMQAKFETVHVNRKHLPGDHKAC
jgi:hypothetical protein